MISIVALSLGAYIYILYSHSHNHTRTRTRTRTRTHRAATQGGYPVQAEQRRRGIHDLAGKEKKNEKSEP
jgi:hypothetical protein